MRDTVKFSKDNKVKEQLGSNRHQPISYQTSSSSSLKTVMLFLLLLEYIKITKYKVDFALRVFMT